MPCHRSEKYIHQHVHMHSLDYSATTSTLCFSDSFELILLLAKHRWVAPVEVIAL